MKTGEQAAFIVFCAIILLIEPREAFSQEDATTNPTPVIETDERATSETDDDSIDFLQERLASRYKLFEQKLFDLYEYEMESNPDRSQLLKQAFKQSQEKQTHQTLEEIQQQLVSNLLNDALKGQDKALKDLDELLTLLQSEHRNQRLLDRKKEVERQIKAVDRLIRSERGALGQTEGGGDLRQLEKTQKKIADRAKQLAEEMEANRPKSEDDSPSNDEEKTPSNEEAKPGEAKPGEAKPGEAKPGEEQAKPDSPEEKIQKHVEDAQKRMEKAAKDLEEARRSDSVEEMEDAITELEEAKKELERILRQLREEEIDQTLANLEARFRAMKVKELKIHEDTIRLSQRTPEKRNSDFEIRSNKLGTEQGKVALDAERALILLREDGSSVAFPVTVEMMQEDMEDVARLLKEAKPDQLALATEVSILETLDFMIDALVAKQKEKEEESKPTPPPGPPGDQGPQAEPPLVNQLEELKMIYALQKRVNKRHTDFSKMLADPNDPIGKTEDPDIQVRLERLAENQDNIHKITKAVVETAKQ